MSEMLTFKRNDHEIDFGNMDEQGDLEISISHQYDGNLASFWINAAEAKTLSEHLKSKPSAPSALIGAVRPVEELFVEEYFGLNNNVVESSPIHTDYGQLVNLLTIFKDRLSAKV